jgi:hypothetical protein
MEAHGYSLLAKIGEARAQLRRYELRAVESQQGNQACKMWDLPRAEKLMTIESDILDVSQGAPPVGSLIFHDSKLPYRGCAFSR